MDIENIRELANIMEDKNINILEFSDKDIKIKLEKGKNYVENPIIKNDSFYEQEAPVTIKNNVVDNTSFGKIEVRSPMVGVFYKASSPESEPFVKVGSKVKKGDVLCIIEAMKLMNEIYAEQDGTITEVCINDGEVVEYSQVLFRMD